MDVHQADKIKSQKKVEKSVNLEESVSQIEFKNYEGNIVNTQDHLITQRDEVDHGKINFVESKKGRNFNLDKN